MRLKRVANSFVVGLCVTSEAYSIKRAIPVWDNTTEDSGLIRTAGRLGHNCANHPAVEMLLG